MIRKLLAVLAFVLSGHAIAAPGAPLIGDWYMEGMENGLQLQITTHNDANGTFTKILQDITRCDAPKRWIETGTWTFDGTTYGTVTETVGGRKVNSSYPGFNDAFTYTPMDEGHFRMYDVKTKIAWQVERVKPDFQMPPLEGCTV